MKASVDKLLNDAEINYLADLFLAHLHADKATHGYRFLRNAVILCSHGAWQLGMIYSFVAACADRTVPEVKSDIERLFGELHEPPHITFNRAYAPPDIEYDTRPLKVQMRENMTVDQTIEFFGTVFMYLVVTNYNKYEYIENA